MTNPRSFSALLGSFFVLLACSSGPGAAKPISPNVTSKGVTPAAPENHANTPPSAPAGPKAYSCEDENCYDFATSDEALAYLLAKKPLVIGFGEMHGQKEEPAKKTAVVFRERFVPKLAESSSALVVELLAPASGCEKEKEKTEHVSGEVTQGQSETNQNDYLALGQASRKLGVVPDILRANCDDMKVIADAGELGVLALMETIARKTAETIERYRAKAPETRPVVLAYGGMLHNDLHPSEDRASWSYGPRLDDKTEHRYLEVDIIAPEQIDDETRFSRFDFARALLAVTKVERANATLIERAERSYALVLPGKRPTPSAGGAEAPSSK